MKFIEQLQKVFIIFLRIFFSNEEFLGYLFLLDPPESSKANEVCVEIGKDVFGNCQNKISKFAEDIECPSCSRSISGTRFVNFSMKVYLCIWRYYFLIMVLKYYESHVSVLRPIFETSKIIQKSIANKYFNIKYIF